MYPTLLELFGQTLPAYFTLLMIGFGVGTWLGSRQARRMGLDHDTFIDAGLFAVIWGVAGGRILHVFADGYFWDYVHQCTDPAQVDWQISQHACADIEGVWDAAAGVCHPGAADCFAWAKFWNGGLAYYGGLIASMIFVVIFFRREGFPVKKGMDLAAFGTAMGLFFGRMGCFLGGCCFGHVTDHPLGVRFPRWSPASEAQFKAGDLAAAQLESLPVHATQLYEALGCLAIATVLMRWVHPRKRYDGQVTLAFLTLYAALRFGLEFLRADARGELAGLSTSQWIGLVLVAGCAAAYVRLRPAQSAQGSKTSV